MITDPTAPFMASNRGYNPQPSASQDQSTSNTNAAESRGQGTILQKRFVYTYSGTVPDDLTSKTVQTETETEGEKEVQHQDQVAQAPQSSQFLQPQVSAAPNVAPFCSNLQRPPGFQSGESLLDQLAEKMRATRASSGNNDKPADPNVQDQAPYRPSPVFSNRPTAVNYSAYYTMPQPPTYVPIPPGPGPYIPPTYSTLEPRWSSQQTTYSTCPPMPFPRPTWFPTPPPPLPTLTYSNELKEIKIENQRLSKELGMEKLAHLNYKTQSESKIEKLKKDYQDQKQSSMVCEAEFDFKIQNLEKALEAQKQANLDYKAKSESLIQGLMKDLDAQEKANSGYEAESKFKIQELQKANSDYEAQMESLKAQYEAQTESKIQGLKKEVETLKQAKLDYEAQIEGLKAQYEAQTESEIQGLRKEVETLKQAKLDYESESEAKVQGLQEELEDEYNINLSYEEQIEGLKEMIKDLEAQVKAQTDSQVNLDYEAQTESLKPQHDSEKEELKRELKELRETWRVSGVLMNTLMQEAVEMRKSNKSLEEEFARLELSEKESKLNFEKLQKEQQSAAPTAPTNCSELSSLKMQITMLNGCLSKKQLELEEAQEEIRELEQSEREAGINEQTNYLLKAKLEETRKERDLLTGQLQKMTNCAKNLILENDKINAQLKESLAKSLRIQAERDQLDGKYLQTKDMMEWAELEIKMRNEDMTAMAEKYRAKQKESEKLAQQIREMEAENTQKSAEIEELKGIVKQQDDMIFDMGRESDEDEEY